MIPTPAATKNGSNQSTGNKISTPVTVRSLASLMLTIPTQVPIVAAMIAELDTLEAKIRLITEYCDTLRNDNVDLRQQLLTAQQELRQLNTRLEMASSRLQALLEKIPEST